MEWKRYFFNIAEEVKKKSKDKNTQIGAVIVGKDKEIVSTGYNSFPRGIDDEKEDRQEKPEKYFWFEHAERNAINAPIQGSAADIIKLAMIKIQTEIDLLGLQSKMLLQVHDELVFDVLKTELPVLKKLIKEIMEGILDLTVPLVVDLDVGKSWLDAH